MNLTETGEARVRGYLYILGRSLRSFMPQDLALDALREVESLIRERIDREDARPSEAEAIARILAEVGPPLQVAQAYSAEMVVEEALSTGGLGAVARALWRLATTTAAGFFAGVALFAGYVVGAAFLVTAALKPIFPENVGLFVVDGIPRGFGAQFPPPPGAEVWGGYAVIPISLVLGLLVLALTQRAARAFLSWWRMRTSGSIRGSRAIQSAP
jgi:hypothetical protein